MSHLSAAIPVSCIASPSIPQPNVYSAITVVCLVRNVASALLALLSTLGGFGALAVVTVAVAVYRSRSARPSRNEDADSDDDDDRDGKLEGQTKEWGSASEKAGKKTAPVSGMSGAVVRRERVTPAATGRHVIDSDTHG